MNKFLTSLLSAVGRSIRVDNMYSTEMLEVRNDGVQTGSVNHEVPSHNTSVVNCTTMW